MIQQKDVVIFILVLARVSSFIALFPLFSQRQLPNLVKVALAVALSVFWHGTVAADPAIAASDFELTLVGSMLMLVKEVSIGIALAILLGLLFVPAKIAGSYVGQELGLSLASISDPGSQDSSTLLSRIFETLAILLFFGFNLHHFVIIVIHVSFDQLLGKIDLTRLPTEQLTQLINRATDYGLQSVGPVLVLLMLITVTLALLNKAAPAMNLFSVGISFRSGFGIFCLLLAFPILMSAMEIYLFQVQGEFEEIIRSIYQNTRNLTGS